MTPSRDILNHPLISQRYFFPRQAEVPSPFFVDVGDAHLACSFHAAPIENAPTVIHFHGNGEVVADYLDGFADTFTRLGWNLLLAEYRGYGMSTGEPLLGRMLDDVEHVVRAARAPPERVVVFGRSVGSIFAIEAVRRFSTIAGIVIESGVAEPLERLLLLVDPRELGVSDREFAATFDSHLDHREKLASYPGAALIMHAIHDGLVPVDNAERLASWASGPVELRRFEHGDHNSILYANHDEYFRCVVEFLSGLAR